ncbi:MAG: ABC transporter permease subunit [Deltaproteobacteria bacterium]|nr:ABC transporter permease subunit [Deltaproteobacteria bacterium]
MGKIFSIALNTFRESVRSKILYSIMFFALLLVGVSAFFGTVTIGDQVIVIKDFGLMSISLFSVAFAVISGSTLLYKELAKKTVYNILAKPVSRGQFVLGKYFGMFATVAVMACLMGLALSLFVSFFEGRADVLLFEAYLYILLELLIICAVAMFFSSIVVTPMLSGLFTFGVFLAGRSTAQMLYFISPEHSNSLGSTLVTILCAILPRLDILNVGNDLVYGASISKDHLMWAALYALAYSGILLILASAIFKRREFN